MCVLCCLCIPRIAYAVYINTSTFINFIALMRDKEREKHKFVTFEIITLVTSI